MFGMLWVVLTFLVKESVQCKWHAHWGQVHSGCAGEVALSRLSIAAEMPAQPSGFWRGNGRVFSWVFFHGMFALDSNLPRLHWAWLCCRNYSRTGDHALFACASLYVPHVRRVFWGEDMPCSWCIFLEICEKIGVLASSLASVSSNGPTNLDPFETQKNANQSAIWTSAGASIACG